MDYHIQLWLKGDFLCHLIDVPIPRVGDLVRTCNEFYKVKAVSFTYNTGYETNSCVVDVCLVEVEE